MHKVWLLSLAGALLLALAPRPASALPDEHLPSIFGTGPNVPPAEYAQRRGGGRGGFSRGYGGYGRVARGYRGGYAYRGRRAVAVRSYRGYGYGRRAVALGGAAYYGSRCYDGSYPYYGGSCPQYYPYGRRAYRGAYYGGARIYRGGSYYRGARVSHYRGGYRGGYRGARVSHYRGGFRGGRGRR